ncbi:hypothetical protein Droror1_Dr00005105 [Drosera rotundifolia]
METKGRLVAGSHNRNEFVLINADDIGKVTSVKELSGQTCQICGDAIEFVEENEILVACNECAFPVCRACYEYERREGTQACPQCKTRYKRLKGSPRVDGDEEEDDIDDIENELDYRGYGREHEYMSESVASGRVNTLAASITSGLATPSELDTSAVVADIPLLTYGEEDAGVSPDKHALIIPPFMRPSKKIHPISGHDPHVTSQPRAMDPSKDLAVYGYGSVAWKDRMEEWKKKQNDKQMVRHEGLDEGDGDGGDDDPVLK